MKTSKDIQAQARRLMRLCLSPEGALDENIVRHISDRLLKEKPRNYLPLLHAFCDLVRLADNRRTATIESAVPLVDGEKEAIRRKLSAKYGQHLQYVWNVRPGLIAGMTVQVGDDVADSSIRTRISQMFPTQ